MQTYLYFSIAFNVVSLSKTFIRITLKTAYKIFPADGTLLYFFVLGDGMTSTANRISVQNGRLSFITQDSVRGAVKKFPEMWYSTVMVGHMTTLT
jgi:hypothetical protein